MVCLIGDIPSTGKLKSGAFQLTLAQDIYSLPSTVYTEVELGEDPRPPSTPAKNYRTDGIRSALTSM